MKRGGKVGEERAEKRRREVERRVADRKGEERCKWEECGSVWWLSSSNFETAPGQPNKR